MATPAGDNDSIQNGSALKRIHFQEEGHRSGYIPRGIIPVDDIGNIEPAGYAPGEKELRCKLASLYRLVDHLGWSQSVFNHITVKVSEDDHHFLLNPFGLLYHEITASSLIKVDVQGNMIDKGSTYFGVNIPGFVLHSAVHSARPDAKCVIHIHHASCIAVASMKCGFLPVSQEAVLVGNVSYHDFYGVLVDRAERETIIKNLGNNHIMFLRNHGLVVAGRTVEEAFTRAYHTVLACEAQVTMMSAGLENLIIVSEEAKQRSMEVVRRAQEMIEDGALKEKAGQRQPSAAGDVDTKEKKAPQVRWNLGDLEFEAYMRMMDNAGYRTGYPYRLPSFKRPTEN
ncbi:hu li tai shao-like protein [Daphnia pulex]|uniref:Hu li tai shao-like protein n=1 Tax=Daphnia pulex TaxID=6669 RepID=E9HJ66_DAPPU|nr:hu li tai shao-like protein [Daphnia pulex]|eukprot:EFX68189.1 hu li tai shao-like protein [Daphnia pulex]